MQRIGRLFLLCAVAGLFIGSAAAQQKYDNSDLNTLKRGNAYTNDDLARYAPLPVQRAPLAAAPEIDLDLWLYEQRDMGADYRALRFYRDRLQAELDYEMARIDAAYSVGGGDFTGSQRQGLKSKLEGRLNRLHREIYLLDWQMARLEGRELPAPDLRR